MVIFASSHTRASHDSPVPFREEVRDAIDQSKVTPYASSFSSAVRLAVESVLKSPLSNKEVYLFSDNQRNALEPVPQSWPEGTADRVKGYVGYIPENLNLPNLEITDLSVAPLSAKAGDPIEVEAKIIPHGDEAPTSVEMHLETGPNNRIYRNITVVPNVAAPVGFGLSRSDAEVDTGSITLQSDVLDSDNAVRYALPHIRPLRILMTQAGGKDETLLFLQLALRLLAQAPVVPTLSAEYAPLRKIPDSIATEQVDVIFVANPGKIDRAQVEPITNWVREGGHLIVAMGSVPTQQINEALVPYWIPERVERWETPLQEGVSPTSFDFTHPWMDRFEKQEEANWQAVKVWGGFEFAEKKDLGMSITPLMTLSRGSPLLWQRDLGLGSISVWMTSLDDQWNDAPRSGLFIALWGEYLRTLAEKKGLNPSFTAGSQVPIEVIRKDDRPTEIHVVAPDGEKEVLAVAGPKLVQTLYYTRTDQIGEYRVEFNEGKLEGLTPRIFAVNIEPGEGNLTGLPFEEMQGMYPFPLLRMDDRSTLAAQMVYSRYGYGIWPFVLALVILLLAVEAWMGRPAR
jgi:hypothetical protein